MNYFVNFFQNIIGGVPGFLYGIILFIIALFVAAFVKKLFIKGLTALKFQDRLKKWGYSEENGIADFIKLLGNCVYFIVFALFLPGIFSALHLENIANPIISMLTRFMTFIPNLVGAVLILVIGIYLAKLVKQIVQPLLARLGVDKFQEKLGIGKNIDGALFSSVIANLAYFVILVPMIISSLQILSVSAISQPAVEMLSRIFSLLPNVLVAVVIIIIGVFIAKLVANLLSGLLSSLGLNEAIAKITFINSESFNKVNIANIISEFVKYIIIIIFTVEGLNLLHLGVLVTAGSAIIAFLPKLIGAFIIVASGLLLASFMQSIILKAMPGSKYLACIVKYIIIVLVAFITLGQLGIEMFIINTAFVIVLCSLAVAAAIAFGIGGRDFAKRTLDNIEKNVSNKKE